jgi:hypothetical protein
MKYINPDKNIQRGFKPEIGNKAISISEIIPNRC